MKAFSIAVVAVIMCGCSMGIVDRTPEQSAVISACFSIKKPAFLYEARCADFKDTGFGGSTFCTGIQGFDPLPYTLSGPPYSQYHHPKSWDDYLSNREEWDKNLFFKRVLEKQRTIIAPLEVGTQLRIIGVYEYPMTTLDHGLIAKAKLITGKYAGTDVELPSVDGFNDRGPPWTIQRFYFEVERKGFQLTTEYLEPCSR